jgi:hypothetical protein
MGGPASCSTEGVCVGVRCLLTRDLFNEARYIRMHLLFATVNVLWNVAHTVGSMIDVTGLGELSEPTTLVLLGTLMLIGSHAAHHRPNSRQVPDHPGPEVPRSRRTVSTVFTNVL